MKIGRMQSDRAKTDPSVGARRGPQKTQSVFWGAPHASPLLHEARRRICAVVPVKESSKAKQRLAGALGRAQRQQLALAMLEDVLATLASTAELASILVVTLDREAAAIAARYGAEVSAEGAGNGHTAAVAAAALRLDANGLDMLTLPADIPLVQPEDIRRLLAVHADAVARAARGFGIAPSRDERGSNAVLCSPAGAVPLRFGDNSFFPHLAAAKACGIEPVVVRLPRVALDIDAPADVALLLATHARSRAHALLRHWRRHGSVAITAFGATPA
jgi:2-phospho-L-lactate/phosphoenolpyruvate guanylyltransferase